MQRMLQFFLTVIGVCTTVLFIPRFLFSSTPQRSIEQRNTQEGQGPDDGSTIDINYGTSLVKGVHPDFRVMRKSHRLFVQAWPSNGKFWRKENPTPADMKFIGLNPSELLVQRSTSQKEEDAFAQQLRLIGAQEWEDEERCEEQYYSEGELVGLRKYHQSIYGWPSNGKGLWVYEYNSLPRLQPRGLLEALRDVQNMDEQCAILQKWQATFYEDPSDYPPIADLFKDQKRGEHERK
ncbi:hypothetical protein ALT_7292 [Aspergillus lentulus]|uniref:Uncharacterized protein n=1 Tax=Aspergillus lentulus TaxID=293939 RepID=A0AAN4PTA3_ASPLE|nr:hypothetical protein ALT_7292 [Aspergillus lentulus]